MPYQKQAKIKQEKIMTNSLEKVLSLITLNTEEAERYMKAAQFNEQENNKVIAEEQISNGLITPMSEHN